jgi:envelope transporter Tic110
MDGFSHVDLESPGFVGRLFGRKPKENALREIQNLLADRAVKDLAAADVENILSEYALPRERASHGLLDFYRQALAYGIKDFHISDDEIADLRQLRYVLGLDEVSATAIEAELLREKYRVALRTALADGHLSDEEKGRLAVVAANFSLPDDAKAAIYKEEVHAVIQEAFNKMIADQRLTAGEEQQLAAMSENLGVKVTYGAELEQKIARYRQLAQVENGQLPQVQCGVLLQRGETCHAQFPSTLHELRTVTKAVAYHGPSGRIRIMKGLSWRYGYVNVQRVTSEQRRELDSGTLLITNKRLLFNGARKNVSLPLNRIIHFTLYKDAVQIEKDSGKDQYFKGSGDLELIGAVLEACLRQR